jgi:hypothetical protein
MARWILLLLQASLFFSFSAQAEPFEMPAWQTEIFRDVEKLYRPAAQQKKQPLVIEKKLDGALEVASADNDGTTLWVVVHGGLLASPRLTPDGLRLTLCHELGHLFGGTPRRNVPPEWTGPRGEDGLSLMSSEGQADYYASAVCFRRLVAGQDHGKSINWEKVTPRLKNLCEAAWGRGTDESLICIRAGLGGDNLLQLVKDFPISFETPDLSKASNLIRDEYPARQCRLDTIVAGALCRDDFPLELKDAGCSQAEAARPACWFSEN